VERFGGMETVVDLARDKAMELTDTIISKVSHSGSGALDTGLKSGVSSLASAGKRLSVCVATSEDPSKDQAKQPESTSQEKSAGEPLTGKKAQAKAAAKTKSVKTRDASTNTGPWRCPRCKKGRGRVNSDREDMEESLARDMDGTTDGLGETFSHGNTFMGAASTLVKSGSSVMKGVGFAVNMASTLVVAATTITSLAVLGTLKTDVSSLRGLVVGLASGGMSTQGQLQGINQQLDSVTTMTNSVTATLGRFSEVSVMNRDLISQLGIPGRFSNFPVTSCAALTKLGVSPSSGYYWVESSTGQSVRVYCDMTLVCGGVGGGWMRVGKLDMRDVTSLCPTGFKLNVTELADIDSGNSTLPVPSLRTCTVASDDGPACSETWYKAFNVSYAAVCGRVIGYQYGAPDAFGDKHNSFPVYVDGVYLTYDNLRKHIWTFAAAYDEIGSLPGHNCPCSDGQSANAGMLPSFVGNDYFCDTASTNRPENRLYVGDPLWDGSGCGPGNSCCSFNSPPWFYRRLPNATSDDVELSVCRDQARSEEDIGIQIVDIFVR